MMYYLHFRYSDIIMYEDYIIALYSSVIYQIILITLLHGDGWRYSYVKYVYIYQYVFKIILFFIFSNFFTSKHKHTHTLLEFPGTGKKSRKGCNNFSKY